MGVLMLKPFGFSYGPRVIFGVGGFGNLPGLIASFGHRVLLVTGGKSLSASGRLEKLTDQLELLNVHVSHLEINGEPSPEVIDKAVFRFSAHDISVIVAIGGGSVLDAGKAIAAMMERIESVAEYLEGVGKKVHDGQRLPLIAVPTTGGTGSEATKNAVLSQPGKNGFKRSLRHENFSPDVAVIDPELALSCPPEITAASGLDALSQLLESWFSKKATVMTDLLALEGLKAAGRFLKRVCKDGKDIEARTGMAYAAFLSGVVLSNAGLGVVHGTAGVIGGYCKAPHGAICGLLLASFMDMTISKLAKEKDQPFLEKAVSALVALEGGDVAGSSAAGLVKYLYELTGSLPMKGLSAYGLTGEDLDVIAFRAENKNNPVDLDREEIREALEKNV
jgi:alcohol dehydrogenase class IV